MTYPTTTVKGALEFLESFTNKYRLKIGAVSTKDTHPILLSESKPATEFRETMQSAFEGMGLSEASAKIAARGRDGAGEVRANMTNEETEEFLIESFKSMGMSEAGAKIAAKGR